MMSRRLAIAAVGILCLVTTSAFAQVLGWGTSGQSVASRPSNQSNIAMTTSGGKAFLAWEDAGGATTLIMCTALDTGGATSPFPANGLVVAANTAAQANPSVLGDGTGGAIIVWQDSRNSGTTGTDIYAQHMLGSGNRMWNGGQPMPVIVQAGEQTKPLVVQGPSNTYYVIWNSNTGVGNFGQDIVMQRLDMNGQTMWPGTGKNVFSGTGNQTDFNAVSDGAGGLIVFWVDKADAALIKVTAQRIDSTGTPQWQQTGVVVSTASRIGGIPVGIPDGGNGAFIAWTDGTTVADSNILAQHIDGNGTLQWAGVGTTVCNATGTQSSPVMVSDGRGGCLIAWSDRRGANRDPYIQRVDASGSVMWTNNGVQMCNVTGDQYDLNIASNGLGGAVVMWVDSRSGINQTKIYGQHVDADGNIKWGIGGGLVAFTTLQQFKPRVVTSGLSDYAITAWEDYRQSGTNGIDVYAQRIGYIPRITAVPPSVDFGTQRNRTHDTVSVHIKNPGTDTLVISDFTFTGPALAADTVYAVAYPQALPWRVAAGADSIMKIVYTSPKNTVNIDTLIVHTNALDLDSVKAIPLTGLGKYPHFKASSDSVVFGGVRLQTSKTKRFVFRNMGTDTGHLFSLPAFQGSFKDQYSDSVSKLFAAPGDSIEVFVTCAPTKLGSLVSQLLAVTDDSTNPYFIRISAQGIFPKTSIPRPGIVFGKVRTGTTSNAQFINVINTGTDTLHVTNLVLTGGDSTKFAHLPVTFPKALKPKDTLKIGVTFSPDSVRTYTTSMQIFTDDTSGFYNTSLVGTGAFAVLDIVKEVNYGIVSAARTYDTTIAVRYTGNDTVTIESATIAVALPASPFTVTTTTFPFKVTAGQSKSIAVHYVPTGGDCDSGTLVIVGKYQGGALDTELVNLRACTTSGVFDTPGLPSGLTLDPSYPNPVSAGLGGAMETILTVNANRAFGFAELTVYNAAGQRVELVHSGALEAGVHRFAVNVASLPAGTYMCRLATREGAATRLITVVR